MATYYSQKSGDATDTTVWNTAANGSGSAPASFAAMNNNGIEIQASHAVAWDGDTSGWANGITGLQINGHETTPGMLYCKYDADGTYYIKMVSANTLRGTTVGGGRGRLLANSDGVWGNTGALPFGRKFTIEFLGTAGTAKSDASNLDIQLYCTQPSNLSARTYGTLYKTTDGTPLSVDYTTDTFTRNTHGWANATAVMFESTGDLPTPLSRDTLYWVVNSATNTFKVAYYSGGTAIDLTDNGTGTISVYNGPSNSTTLNVLDDVTADAAWITTAGHNRVVLASAGPEAYNQLRTTLGTITATQITLAANGIATLRPNTRIWLMARNILIKTNTTSATATVDWGASTFTGSVLQCELWSAAGTGTTFYGYGVSTGYSHTLAGTISGYSIAAYNPVSCTMSGVIAACTNGYYPNSNNPGGTLSGVVTGCVTGVVGKSITFSGKIYGCTNAMNNVTDITITADGIIMGGSNGLASVYGGIINGTLRNLQYCISTGYGIVVSGVITGCTYGIYASYSGIVSGTLIGNSSHFYQNRGITFSGTATYGGWGSNAPDMLRILGGTFANNTSGDILLSYSNVIYGYEATLKSATQISNYKHSQQGLNSWGLGESHDMGVFIYDLCDSNGVIQPGYIGVWVSGGYTKTTAWVVGTHGTPPITLAAVHVSTFEDSDRDTWAEFPIMGKANQQIKVTVYHKVTTTSNWTTAPLIEICNPNIGWKLEGEVLASSSSFSVADTDWHTDSVSYTPAYDRPITVRIRGCGGVAAGTGTGQMYWWQNIELSPPAGVPMIGGRTIRRSQ